MAIKYAPTKTEKTDVAADKKPASEKSIPNKKTEPDKSDDPAN